MKYNCDMIRDLLPLYQDGVCSESSRAAVEEHLAGCAGCTDYLASMRDSGIIEETMNTEREDAISSQARFFKRRSAVVGAVFAGLFMLPVVICMIVGLATGGISWVLIVLAAMLIPVSLTAVPLLASENKALWTLGASAVSLTLLLGVCCAVSGGKWFFIAAPAVLFGIAVFFAPFAVRAKPVAARVGSRKGLAVLGLDTALYIIMMLGIGLTNGLSGSYYRLAAEISVPILIWIWSMFVTIRYMKARGVLKAALILGITAAVMLICDLIFGIGQRSSIAYIEAFDRRFEFGTYTVTAVLCAVIGAVLALIGALTGKKRRK